MRGHRLVGYFKLNSEFVTKNIVPWAEGRMSNHDFYEAVKKIDRAFTSLKIVMREEEPRLF